MKPLSDVEFQLLALLSTQEKSGREIAQQYEAESGYPISYGTLYTTLRRLKEMGCVETRDDIDGDGRVRYFTLTGGGRNAIQRARRDYQKLAGFALKGAQT